MPLQNRVTPFGALVATDARGTMFGQHQENRQGLYSLSGLPTDVRLTPNSGGEADIARGIQEAIEESNIKHVKIRNVRKRPNHKVIVQCLDENEAELVRKLDWERAFPRLVGRQTPLWLCRTRGSKKRH